MIAFLQRTNSRNLAMGLAVLLLTLVLSDWIAPALYNSKKYPGPTAAENVAAGGDLFMPGRQGDVDCICAALADGTLSEDALRRSAGRVIRMCRALGGEPPRNDRLQSPTASGCFYR